MAIKEQGTTVARMLREDAAIGRYARLAFSTEQFEKILKRATNKAHMRQLESLKFENELIRSGRSPQNAHDLAIDRLRRLERDRKVYDKA